MKIIKFEDLSYKAQEAVLDFQDRLNRSGRQDNVYYLERLMLSLRDKDKNNSLPISKKAIFVLKENEDGLKSYAFSHAELD